MVNFSILFYCYLPVIPKRLTSAGYHQYTISPATLPLIFLSFFLSYFLSVLLLPLIPFVQRDVILFLFYVSMREDAVFDHSGLLCVSVYFRSCQFLYSRWGPPLDARVKQQGIHEGLQGVWAAPGNV